MKHISPMSYFFTLLLCWVLLSSPQNTVIARQDESSVHQAARNSVLCITDAPDTSEFPIVSLNIKVLDSNLLPGINLINNDLRFYENNKTEIRPLADRVIRANQNLGGISYYVLADTGNRSDQSVVKNILQNFSSYYINQTDNLKIFTNPANQPFLYYSSDSGMTLSQAISNFSTNNDTKIRQVSSTLFTILDEIELAPVDCSKSTVLILIIGDEALPEKDIPRLYERLNALPVKLILFHLPNLKTNEFRNQSTYSNFAQQAKGLYHSVIVGDDARFLASPALDQIIDFRQTYTVSYRSNVGESGLRQITANYKGTPAIVQGFSSYSIQLQPGQVGLPGDKVITVQEGAEQSAKFQINVSWPDGYPRILRPNALLHLTDDGGKDDTININLEKIEGNYQFEWSFADRTSQPINKFSIQVEVFDEFGESLRTPKNTITINMPAPVVEPGKSEPSATPWWVYALAVGIAFVFLLALLLFLVLWKKLGDVSLNGVQNLASVAKQNLQNIQKTIVGGGKNRKPVAVLRIIDGPKKIVGQDLKVNTENITLGRDPQKTHFTFYDLETSTSVSGIHAIIERVNGNWRIVAVSESRSETFVNGTAIDFQEPTFLKSGDIVRLGYLAQQPVEFQFVTDVANHSKAATSQISTQSRSVKVEDPDITLTVDTSEGVSETYIDNEKTAVVDSGEQAHIGITQDEKNKIKTDKDDVDDYINKLRKE